MTKNNEQIPNETKILAHERACQKLIDSFFKVLREMPSDWRSMSEDAQKNTIQKIDFLVENILRSVIDALATDGRNAIKVTVDSMAVKDSLKLQLIAPKTVANINDIGEAQGSWAYLITYNEKNNMDRILPKAEPDQHSFE